MRGIDLQEFVTVGSAARELGVSTERVRQLADAGRLAAVRGPGGDRFLIRESVSQLAKERERARSQR